MDAIKKYSIIGIAAALSFSLYGCSPEVGSEKWCADLKKKEAGDMTANDVADYAKHCIFKEQE